MTDHAKLPSTRKALLEAARLIQRNPPKHPSGGAGGAHSRKAEVRDTLATLRKLLAVRGT